jgi:F-type H+-transporting ATPase subunit epsilon
MKPITRPRPADKKNKMETTFMELKILLPFRVFADTNHVSSIVMETSEGSYGLLPDRLDCVAALIPGIFTYVTATDGPHYLAIEAGLLVKAGRQVLVSVRNAIGGVDLGQLAETVKKELAKKKAATGKVRSVMEKLESGFVYSFDKFLKE